MIGPVYLTYTLTCQRCQACSCAVSNSQPGCREIEAARSDSKEPLLLQVAELHNEVAAARKQTQDATRWACADAWSPFICKLNGCSRGLYDVMGSILSMQGTPPAWSLHPSTPGCP